MGKIAIMTDSNSGITQKEGKEQGIFVVPMPFLINDEEYFEDITLNQEEFYEKLTQNATVSTSQPSIENLTKQWDEILEEYEELMDKIIKAYAKEDKSEEEVASLLSKLNDAGTRDGGSR